MIFIVLVVLVLYNATIIYIWLHNRTQRKKTAQQRDLVDTKRK